MLARAIALANCSYRAPPHSHNVRLLLECMTYRLLREQEARPMPAGLLLPSTDLMICLDPEDDDILWHALDFGNVVILRECFGGQLGVELHLVRDGRSHVWPGLSLWLDPDRMDLWLVNKRFRPDEAFKISSAGVKFATWAPAPCRSSWLHGCDLSERAQDDWRRKMEAGQ